MQAILFALFSYIGWGVGDIFGTVAARRMPALSLTFWVMVFGFVLFSLYIPFAVSDLQRLTFPIFVLIMVLGVLFTIGELAFNQALRVSNASVAETIGSSFPAITVVLSLFFLGERVSTAQLAAILTILVGVVLSTLNFADLRTRGLWHDKGVVYALFCMLCWGVYFALIKIPIQQIGWFWPTYLGFALFPLMYLFVKWRGVQLQNPNDNSALIPILFSVALLRSGDLAFNYAISKGLTAVVAPIAGSYATLFVLLSFMIFKDPIKRSQIVGIVVTLLGIVTLSIVSRQ